jgi:MOSC domain-containing protein YiiM
MGKIIGIASCEKKGGSMVVYASAKASIESGIGDDYRGIVQEDSGYQLTIIAVENWNRVCSELGRKLHWTTRGANLIIEGVDLENSTGDLLKIGNFFVEITGEYKPEQNMDDKILGLRDALVENWRGGVTAKVIQNGIVNENDEVIRGVRE